MINEIQKRPFVRPLGLWITGILLYSFFPDLFVIGGLLLICLFVFFLLFFCFGREESVVRYDTRWVWGVLFAFLFVVLAMLVTKANEKKSLYPSSPGVVETLAAQSQYQLVESIDELCLSDTEKSVLATLTLGYKKALSKEVRSKFSVAGVSHILAVSGFHVAVVSGFLSFLLGFLPQDRGSRLVRYLLMMALLWCFVFVTGLAASSVRAGLMLSFYLTGRVLGRDSDRYNTLAAAAFCMLAYNPGYLFDIGFQLSYTAVFFILYLQPRLQRLIKVRNPLIALFWNGITVTVAAQAGVTFLCLYYFGYFSTVFLFVNIPVVFIATLLIPSALLWLLLPGWFPGYVVLQRIVEELMHLLWRIVERFAGIPGASWVFRFDIFSLLAAYGMLLFFLLYVSERKAWLCLAGLFVLFLLLLVRVVERFVA